MTPSSTASSRPPTADRDHRTPVRHRLPGDHAVPLATRRAGDDGRPLVVGAELARRHEALSLGHAVAKRAVADDDARQPLGRLEELEDPLLLREAPDVEDVRRLRRLTDLLGNR